eukprot:10841967-Prorocentrum_lima.AAC.1
MLLRLLAGTAVRTSSTCICSGDPAHCTLSKPNPGSECSAADPVDNPEIHRRTVGCADPALSG